MQRKRKRVVDTTSRGYNYKHNLQNHRTFLVDVAQFCGVFFFFFFFPHKDTKFLTIDVSPHSAVAFFPQIYFKVLFTLNISKQLF